MKKIRLFIARHGQTDYNRRGLLQGRGIDAPLDETGFRQADLLSTYLSGYDTDGLYSSSLVRTWQTAEPLRKAKKMDIVREKDLDEMHFGEFEGKPYLDAARELDNIQKFWKRGDLDVPVPGGESPRQVFDRANAAFHDIVRKFSGTSLVMILHGRLIRILVSEWLGMGLKNMHKIEHQNAGINQLVYDGSFKAVYLNKTDHLVS
ncbi:histidine phosphatase family protein [Rhodohalobacter mucosus]|uniref:Histidine phosphatase family protein n=1 Tax=Rhodohalobacter mucosus TaxID=2079485 RepID=A0A316TR33_9BACT|nr:histidine phosphatase family protein [Rhodohalobacter mucosus]PWN06268.1 histidine phosphatase family protein [Rhodohalobacter mucosus]